ncbi:MAG: hypothetical protein ABTD50_04600 [Polyangiaceae bacterium]
MNLVTAVRFPVNPDREAASRPRKNKGLCDVAADRTAFALTVRSGRCAVQ